VNRDKTYIPVRGPRHTFFNRLSNVEHLGVKKHLLPVSRQAFDQPINAFSKRQP
jgi:hypothetical protein